MGRQTFFAMLILMLLCSYHMALAAVGQLQMRAEIVNQVVFSVNEHPNLLSFASNNLTSLAGHKNVTTGEVDVKGLPHSTVQLSIANPNVTLNCQSTSCQGEKIDLSQLSLKGPVNKNGVGILNQQGQIKNIKIAANESLNKIDRPGIFTNQVYLQLTTT